MKVAQRTNDWQALYAVAHKIIPSLSIVGIKSYYIEMTKTLQENARGEKNTDEIKKSVYALTTVLTGACEELGQELNLINSPILCASKTK